MPEPGPEKQHREQDPADQHHDVHASSPPQRHRYNPSLHIITAPSSQPKGAVPTMPFPPAAHCPRFQASVELLGSRWTASILRVLLQGPHRFTDLLETVPRLSSRLLSQRLDELAAAGIVTQRPGRREYQLTAKGEGLREAFAALEAWNARWDHSGATPSRGAQDGPGSTAPDRQAEPTVARSGPHSDKS